MSIARLQTLHVIARHLVDTIGDDQEREGLQETPARYAKAMEEWFAGYNEADFDPKAFTDGADGYDQMVIETGIPVWSHCEHHIAPFFGHAHIAYIPNGRIIGLSKLPRLVNHFARRLQVQERLTTQIADALQEALTESPVNNPRGGLTPHGIGVVVQCRHTCMESRGIRTAGVVTTTSAMLGALREDSAARAEFLAMVPKP